MNRKRESLRGWICILTICLFISFLLPHPSRADEDDLINILKNKIQELEKRDVENRVIIKDLKDTIVKLMEQLKTLQAKVEKQDTLLATIPQRVPRPEQSLIVEEAKPIEIETQQPASINYKKKNTTSAQTRPDTKARSGSKPVKQDSETKKLPSSEKKKLYDIAFKYFSSGSYKTARRKFEEFIDKYPDDDLTDNAQYWIGECDFKQGEYLKAVEEFQKVIEYYPLGNKVPDAYLKIGYSYLKLKDQASALSYFNAVRDMFPHTDASLEAEKKIRELTRN